MNIFSCTNMLMPTASYMLLHYKPVYEQKQENMHLTTRLHRHALTHARTEILQSVLIIFSLCSVRLLDARLLQSQY